MKDLKTTVPGIVAALAMIAKMIFKTDIPDGVSEGITAIAIFCIGLFAKDTKIEIKGGN